MRQKSALALGALAAAAAAYLLGRRRSSAAGSQVDPRAEELRHKLAEARRAGVDENEFEAAGMGAETVVAEERSPDEPAPKDEFEAMRRRVHEEARAAAEEMQRDAETPE